MSTPKARYMETAQRDIDHWRQRAEDAEAHVEALGGMGPPPMVSPGVPAIDYALPSGRQLRFTANFGVFLTIMEALLGQGLTQEELNNLNVDEAVKRLVHPAPIRDIIARAGMPLQPNENWESIFAQMEMDSAIQLVGWLIGAAFQGQDELAKAAEEESPGEAQTETVGPDG